MAIECEIITEVGQASNQERLTLGISRTVSAFALVGVVLGLSVSLSETATAASATEARSIAILHGSASAQSYATGKHTATLTVVEQRKALSGVRLTIKLQAIGTAHAASILESSNAYITERATATDSVVIHRTSYLTLTETAQADGLLGNQAAITAVTTAQAASFPLPSTRASMVLLSTAAASSSAEIARDTDSQIIEKATAGSATVLRVQAAGVVVEWGGAYGEAVPTDAGSIWTCAMLNMGMSLLQTAKVESAAMVNGVLCGIGPAGLYVFDTAPEEAYATTGLKDFGDALTRATHCYAAFSGDGLELTIGNTGTQSGAEASYDYAFESRAAESAVPARTKLGRGVKSRFWRVTVRGQSFSLHDLKMVTDSSSRRV